MWTPFEAGYTEKHFAHYRTAHDTVDHLSANARLGTLS